MVGVDMAEEPSVSKSGGGVAMDFVVSEEVSSPMPRRLKDRMMVLEEAVNSRSPGTLEDIEAKLRHACMRRQQFYEKLSRKPKRKVSVRSQTAAEEGSPGQRLEARLLAAEHKRSTILANARMRLARLDELRQAAKSTVEMRFEREREVLGCKVELRVQQAEANRLLLLKAFRERRARVEERTSQQILRQLARESKYKESICAAIYRKRIAAEKKRLGLLEAEKKRARARMLRVQRVARSVSQQREIERRKMMNQLEERFQRAMRQRAEYLRQRARKQHAELNWNNTQNTLDLARKIARYWLQFLRTKRTTIDLVKEYLDLNINGKSVKTMPFEQLASMIESPNTLQRVKALLERIESRFRIYKICATSEHVSTMDNIDHLLLRVSSPKKRSPDKRLMKGRNQSPRNFNAGLEKNKCPAKLLRYPVRVVLCAFMILGHPDAVFSGQGEREIALAKSAEEFVHEFELLSRVIVNGPMHSSDQSALCKHSTFRSQLACFDRAWYNYLECFVTWKVKDAESLEGDLIRAACQLELSMIQTCKMCNGKLSHDMMAIQKQVSEDQKLLREKLHHLSGDAGIHRMENALCNTRSKVLQAKDKDSPLGSSAINLASAASSSSAVLPRNEKSSSVVRSLFKVDLKCQGAKTDSAASSSSRRFESENEIIVNEFLHDYRDTFTERFSSINSDGNGFQAKLRKTMESAFWDNIMKSAQGDEPNFDSVVRLVMEVRDELCEMAPASWKGEIHEAIDLEILSQLISVGKLDVAYLGKLLQFALNILQKLCSPAQETEMKLSHQKLMQELIETCESPTDNSKSRCIVAMIKGLRYVLEQIQDLKKEISRARVMLMEPLLKGPAGLEYLRNAFLNHYGNSSSACNSLPLTKLFLALVMNDWRQEWEAHTSSLSAVVVSENPAKVPTTLMRTGARFQSEKNAKDFKAFDCLGIKPVKQECKGESLDLFVRLGLLKLVFGISGLTQESLPETFALNFVRLRGVQAEIQKIIFVCTSILVYRQIILVEHLVTNSTEMERMLLDCSKILLDRLDQNDDVSIEGIVEIISSIGLSQNGSSVVNVEQQQSRKLVMARMLHKSIQPADAVFEKVSRAIYVAARSLVLGGISNKSRQHADVSLRQIGAQMLADRVEKIAEVLVIVASISIAVHGSWYATLIGS